MRHESENIEYKSQLLEDLYKEVIAFANTTGGIIYIGVDDDGNYTGIDNVDETYTRITNGIRDAIQPDVTMFIRYLLQDNRIIQIEVGEGSYKPYYLKGKGLKPSGVFVRQGATSVPASTEQIRQMIKQSDGDIFETMRSVQQDLTFQKAEETFARYQVQFSKEKYTALGIQNLHDAQYTNLAWILSDQCQHTVKVAVFGDTANTLFKDAKEFSGSVFQQLDDTYAYLSFSNRTAYRFQGLERVEMQDYPEEALREALLNALVHRDYSFSGSIIINVNEACMEFISLGGLLPGLSPEDIQSGISQPRNRNLAEIFHRLKLIESYGTGIRRIFHLYDQCEVKPRIEVTPNTFKLILPNMNAVKEQSKPFSNRYQSATEKEHMAVHERSVMYGAKSEPHITAQMYIVLDYLKEHDELGEEELQDLLNVKRTRAYLLARTMQELGLIRIEGRGAAKKYKLV